MIPPMPSSKNSQSPTLSPPVHPLWARAIAQPAQEFAATPLKVLSGAIPAGLRGTLYRNGPGRVERGEQKVSHWFDGDGAILAVHFREEGATGLYRYVQTSGFLAEEQAGHYLFSGYDQLAPGPFWRRWGTQPKHTANTSVLALDNKLLALWEGGHPYSLDLNSLATLGLDNLGGLASGQPYSAHPKHDPQTGEIYNFGISFGRTIRLNLYCSDASGQIKQKSALPLDRFSLIHDFTLAGRYLIFLIPPLQAQIFPLLLGLKSFSQSFQWQPQWGTQVLVIDRETLQLVKQFETDPWFQWHFGNSYEDRDGSVVINFVRYQDWRTNTWLGEVVSGHPTTNVKGLLWRLQLHPQQGKVLATEQLLDLNSDFPVMPVHEAGQNTRYLYLNCHDRPDSDPAEMFNSVARVDLSTGALSLARPGVGCYPMEPIPVRDRLSDQTWILTVVYDGNHHQSTVQIYPADRLEEGPLCVLSLPQVIPFGFHGCWHPLESD